MAYEFIATGLRPAKPISSFLDSYTAAQETKQQEEANKVNIEAGQKRNELADIQLQDARKQVAAEEQWAKLPRDENGSIDPQAEQQFKTQFPEYYDTRKKAEVASLHDQFGLAADKLNLYSKLYENVKSDDDVAKVEAYAQENFGFPIKYDPALSGPMKQYSSELANTSALIQNDIKLASANGDWETVKRLQDAWATETELKKLEVQKAQAAIARDRAAAAASRAKSYNGGLIKPPAGYRWTADGSQEPIPGGPVDIKNKKAAAVEAKALESTTSVIDTEIKNIDKLIGSEDGKTKKHPGLDSMLGSIDSRIPSVMTDTRNAEALLESLQSKASIAALRDIRSGGSQSIGQITEREWPRLENMKATLQMYQDEKQFTKNLKEYRDELIRMRNHALTAYDEFTRNADESAKSNDLSKYSTEDLLDMLNNLQRE